VKVWGLTAAQQRTVQGTARREEWPNFLQVTWVPAVVLPVPAATFHLQHLPPEQSELHQFDSIVVIQVCPTLQHLSAAYCDTGMRGKPDTDGELTCLHIQSLRQAALPTDVCMIPAKPPSGMQLRLIECTTSLRNTK